MQRTLKSFSRYEFPVAYFASPPGYFTGIPTQHIWNRIHGCLPQACLSSWLPISVTGIIDLLQSHLLETSKWPLIFPSLVSPLFWLIAKSHRHFFRNIYHIHPSHSFPLLPNLAQLLFLHFLSWLWNCSPNYSSHLQYSSCSNPSYIFAMPQAKLPNK